MPITDTKPLSMDTARQQQHARQQARDENTRRRQAERREWNEKSLRSALDRHSVKVPDHATFMHRRPGPGQPDVAVEVGAYRFGWDARANHLMLQVTDDDGERIWQACPPQPTPEYPLAWLADAWDDGLGRLAEQRRRQEEQRIRREHAENMIRDPEAETSGPEPYTIARESPMGQLIAGLVDVISASGGHGQLW